MSAPWTSGSRAFLCNVCAGDLIEVRLKSAVAGPGPAPAELAVNGYVPHLVYVPEFGHNHKDLIGGEQDKDDPNEWRVNLQPIVCPYRGGLYLDGGAGVAYDVRIKRARCREFYPWTITLRDIGVAPIAVPQGVYAIEAPRDVAVTLDSHGDILNLSLTAGVRFELGHLSQGTIASPAATIEALTCHVRIG